ncbi:MAG: type II toxin-antitoxin system VapC family toxin, partial [SAR202 cluster bacterium]|nr:type II toxin-antitoxin system VapC family toxin [SAR202 cluster bacterium]
MTLVADRSHIVIDANIAINVAVTTHPYHEQALRLTQEWLDDGNALTAPPLFESEVDSFVRLNTTRGIWTPDAGRGILRIVDSLPVTMTHDPRVRGIARSIAETFDERGVYDSTYAALAQLLNCEFWTADRRFYQRVHDQ